MAGFSFFFPFSFSFLPPSLVPTSSSFPSPFSSPSLYVPFPFLPFLFVLLFLLFICLSCIQLSVPCHSKQSLMTCVKRRQEATHLFPWGQICSFSNLGGNHPFITRDTLLGLRSKIPSPGISLVVRGPGRSCTPWIPLFPKELSLGILTPSPGMKTVPFIQYRS